MGAPGGQEGGGELRAHPGNWNEPIAPPTWQSGIVTGTWAEVGAPVGCQEEHGPLEDDAQGLPRPRGLAGKRVHCAAQAHQQHLAAPKEGIRGEHKSAQLCKMGGLTSLPRRLHRSRRQLSVPPNPHRRAPAHAAQRAAQRGGRQHGPVSQRRLLCCPVSLVSCCCAAGG